MSKTATCGMSGNARLRAHDPLEVGRVVQRGERRERPQSATTTSSSTTTGSVNRRPAVHDPVAHRDEVVVVEVGPVLGEGGAGHGERRPVVRDSSTRALVAAPVQLCGAGSRRRSRTPARRPRCRPLAASSSWYFSDEDPALTTRTCGRGAPRRAPLHRGDRDRVDDVAHQGAAGQVVDRAVEALQHRPDRHRVGAALHRLVGVVAGVEVGEDEHRRTARHRTVLELGAPRRAGRRPRRTGSGPRRAARARARGPARSQRAPSRRPPPCPTPPSSTTASPPAARCRSARRCGPRRSRCRPAARPWGRG